MFFSLAIGCLLAFAARVCCFMCKNGLLHGFVDFGLVHNLVYHWLLSSLNTLVFVAMSY